MFSQLKDRSNVHVHNTSANVLVPSLSTCVAIKSTGKRRSDVAVTAAVMDRRSPVCILILTSKPRRQATLATQAAAGTC